MENKKSTSASAGGIGFCGLLTIVFIVLKLLHVINWSWFWVLSPVIFSIGFGLLILLIVTIVFFVIQKL